MHLSALDLAVVVAYLLVALIWGARHARRAGSGPEQFFAAGRSLPWWVAGTSIVATTFAADTPLAIAGLVATEGIAGIDGLLGGGTRVGYDRIPAVVYTHPEIAMVGRTQEQLEAEGIPFRKGVSPYGANGRARSLGDVTGKVKLLAHAGTDRNLGAHVIGLHAGDLIAEIAAAMAFHASSEDLTHVVHAHPTLAEIVQEAALAVDGRAIHS